MGGGFRGWVAGGSFAGVVAVSVLAACGTSDDDRGGFVDPGPDGGGLLPIDGGFAGDAIDPGLPPGETRDPTTCDEAKTTKSYVGCDYWPTVTANAVWSIFDFAVVVANTGTNDATVTVTGPGATNAQVVVKAGQLEKIYLPWVPSLKGPDADECLFPTPVTASVVEAAGAFHLVSTSPVIVYQFNALEYKGQGGQAPGGGAKDWSTCPGTAQTCNPPVGPSKMMGCFSFSNDASLLLPSTAMTGNYRIVAQHGWTEAAQPLNGSIATITATQPQTQVTVTLAPTASIQATQGGAVSIPATSGGGKITFTLAGAGDVAQLVTELGTQYDLSGSLVQANKPVQVLASEPCISLPEGKGYCDHLEESVPPAETLGKRYVVHPPTGPKGSGVDYALRLYGNKDGTMLAYKPAKPAGCPDALSAGQVADCGIVNTSFEVSGTSEFAVATFLLGASHYDPTQTDLRGDPSLSTFASIEQFRTKYLFLAPDDFSVSYVDITAPHDAGIELDGQPLAAAFVEVSGTGFGIYRVPLGAGQAGAHTLTSKLPVGIQVVGFGDHASYQYPGGLNLNLIAPPPPPPK